MDPVQGIPEWITVVIYIVAGLGGLSGIAALINSFTKASSSRVDTLCTIINTQAAHIDSQDQEITALKRIVENLRAEVAEWQKKYERLLAWVKAQGLNPFKDVK